MLFKCRVAQSDLLNPDKLAICVTMSKKLTPFTRFQNHWFFVLLAVYVAYSTWYLGPGFYGQLAALGSGMPLEERGYYSGAFAVETLSALSPEGRKTKYLSLLFDIPYMIMTALILEAMMMFGLLSLKKDRSKWAAILGLPIIFLLVDFFEDSALALTLVSGSEVFGTVAGIMTPLKFTMFSIASLAAIIFSVCGGIALLRARLRV